MPKQKKRSFFERLTGSVRMTEEGADSKNSSSSLVIEKNDNPELWETGAEETDGELALDVYQTASEIIVQTFVAGVKPEDLEINITRDMLTLRGKRMETRTTKEDDYFSKELYWGSFSRTISLPEEVDVDNAEAVEKHGLLILKLPKLDKKKQSRLKVKTI